MVKNAARKNAARMYHAEHPELTYPEAARRAQAEHLERKAKVEAEKQK